VRGGLAALIAALACAAHAFAAAAPPALRLANRHPVVIVGAHFKGLERVTVTASGLRPQTKRVRATRAGLFSVTLDRVIVSRCGLFGIRAIGSRGSVASLKFPLPACMAS
jgi:hypothetical protein